MALYLGNGAAGLCSPHANALIAWRTGHAPALCILAESRAIATSLILQCFHSAPWANSCLHQFRLIPSAYTSQKLAECR